MIIRLAALLSTATLASCGVSYEIVPARLTVENVQADSLSSVTSAVGGFLTEEGFENLGKYQEMISLIEGDTSMPERLKREQLARLERERTYLNERHHLRVVMSDFSTGVPPEIRLNYSQASDHFVQLDVSDERPGGFGPYGLSFYGRFLARLKQRYGDSVRVVAAPPPTNEGEYRRVTTANTIAAALGWSLAFAFPFLITGAASYYLLRRLRVPRLLKQIIFIAVNTWLDAPLPFPAAFIFVMPAPNLFAFPWTSMDYYSRVSSYAVRSFPLALLLCAVISAFLFRRRAHGEPRTSLAG
jgi:hypothetical protein